MNDKRLKEIAEALARHDYRNGDLDCESVIRELLTEIRACSRHNAEIRMDERQRLAWFFALAQFVWWPQKEVIETILGPLPGDP
jgi:hypothetical protein